MKWYLILAHDVPDSLSKRLSVRPAHLARLEALATAGRLLVAGPLPLSDIESPSETGFSGSAIVAGFPSLADARTWVDGDPFVAAGVYDRVDIKPFMKVFPK